MSINTDREAGDGTVHGWPHGVYVCGCMASSNAYFLNNRHHLRSSDTQTDYSLVRQAGADKRCIWSDCTLLNA